MKKIHKKIGAMALAGMVVAGGVAASGVKSHAASSKSALSEFSKVQLYNYEYAKKIFKEYGYDVVIVAISKRSELRSLYRKAAMDEHIKSKFKQPAIRNKLLKVPQGMNDDEKSLKLSLKSAKEKKEKFLRIVFDDIEYVLMLR